MVKSSGRVLVLLRALVPLLIFLSIWWPEFDHFRIDRAVPDASVIAQLSRQPDPGRLAEIAAVKFQVSLGIPLAQRALVAHTILDGKMEATDYLPTAIVLRGWPADLAYGGPTFQLALASLSVEDLLLEEFESSQDQRFYQAARDRILAFAEWESRQSQPYAFLWNDHAVAARVSVLVRLWRTLREAPAVTLAQRASLLSLVARSGELLAKPSQFTVRTNHGVMQNLALLQITAAFPDLPKSPAWRSLALERLELQMGFYVSDEGVVLEHSSEYHVFGQQLTGHAIQLARLNGVEPSQRLLKAHDGAANFTQRLLRPDGSLPLVGNTAASSPASDNHTHAAARPSTAPYMGSDLYPLSGYAIWMDTGGTPAHTLVAWAKHDRHGHKHADEPSVHFWSRDMDWITATGYWPYGERGYDQANGWEGSNAPHAKGEAAQNPRVVHLLGTGETGTVRALDIENFRQSGLKVRRQIVQITPEQLLVLDNVSGAAVPVETLWTLDPRLTLQSLDGQRYRSSDVGGGYALQINLAHAEAASLKTTLHRGSWFPFAGWVVVGRKPTPAATLRVERPPGDSVTATLFTVGNQTEPVVMALAQGSLPESWTIDSRSATGPMRVTREGESIRVTSPLGETLLKLAAPPSLEARQSALRGAMSEAIERYPPWRALADYHQRLYVGIFLLWAMAEVMLGLLAWKRLRRKWMDSAVIAGWAGVAWWIHVLYLT